MESVRKLDKKLGIGARGVVYQGFDEDKGRFVAIKEIPLIERSFGNDGTPLRPSAGRRSPHAVDTSMDDDLSTDVSAHHDDSSQGSPLSADSHDPLCLCRPSINTDPSASRLEEEEEAAQILREIHVMARAKHPNLVRYYGTRRSAVGVQLIMEFVGGGSLESLMKRCGALREGVVRRYTNDILHGLAYLHDEMKVCHRDIKPGNVLLTTEGQCKLTDFGVSKVLGGGNAGSSTPGSRRGRVNGPNSREGRFMHTTVGTPWYMAPEVISGGVDDEDVAGLEQELRSLLPRPDGASEGYSTAADIWSLGVTVFEMLSGERPFGAGLSNPTAVLFRIASTAAAECPQLPDGCGASQEARDFLDLCFVYDRTLRPSARELLSHAWFRHNSTNDENHSHVSRGPQASQQQPARAGSLRPPQPSASPDRGSYSEANKFAGALDAFDVASVTPLQPAQPTTRAGAAAITAPFTPPLSRQPPPPSSARSTSRTTQTTTTQLSPRSTGSTPSAPRDPAAARYALLRQHASRLAAAQPAHNTVDGSGVGVVSSQVASSRGAGQATTSTGLWTRDGYYVDLLSTDPLENL